MSLIVILKLSLLVLIMLTRSSVSLLMRRCAPVSIRARTTPSLSMSTSASFLGVSSSLSSSPNYTLAADHLREGKLVSFPTETVYGLGANALDCDAIKSIFIAKKRPLTDPLIVHILRKDDMYELFDFDHNGDDAVKETVGERETKKSNDSNHNNGNAKRVCELLASHFWPGPLTIIYKANTNKLSSDVIDTLTANTGYLGVRVPQHK